MEMGVRMEQQKTKMEMGTDSPIQTRQFVEPNPIIQIAFLWIMMGMDCVIME